MPKKAQNKNEANNEVKKNIAPEEQDVSKESLDKVEEIARQFNGGKPEKDESIEEAQAAGEWVLMETSYKQEISQLSDKILRLNAEMENLRRRHQKERVEAESAGIKNFATDLTSVLDNLFRAAESITDELVAQNEQIANLKTGVDMTKREMLTAFERYGIKRIDPKGEQFDHNFHQAVSEVADAEHAPGTVIQVIQSGYTLKEKLLRPALVVLAKAAA